MKDKVIEILNKPKNEESINELCDLCDILKFQASNIIDEFKSIVKTTTDMLSMGADVSNYNVLKQNIIRGLTSGEYSKKKSEDLKNEVLKILKMPVNEEVINRLCFTCDITYVEAASLIERYQHLENSEIEAIRNGMNGSTYNREKYDIINKLSTLK